MAGTLNSVLHMECPLDFIGACVCLVCNVWFGFRPANPNPIRIFGYWFENFGFGLKTGRSV